MRILGLSAYYHDSAAALIQNGRIIAAAQEERFTRKKHDPAFPQKAIAFCLKEAAITLDEVDQIAFFEKPFIKFERLLETYMANAPRGFRSFKMAIPVWIKEKLFQKSNLIKALEPFAPSGDVEDKLLFAEHHQSHAASAFYPSPFQEAVILTMDGVGEWATASVAIGREEKLETVREILWPHSPVFAPSRWPFLCGLRKSCSKNQIL